MIMVGRSCRWWSEIGDFIGISWQKRCVLGVGGFVS
ncbi:MAG: hypothetical protein RI897_2381 [Verrucomicrobiota bacterium]